MRNWLIGLLVLIGLLGAGYWIYTRVTRPLPGQKVPDLGREHVPDEQTVEYNSNPPTSGPHYEEWTKAGVYDKPVSDGHLVHSLEHGYVIISYNCQSVRAGGEESVSLKKLVTSTLQFFYSPALIYAHEEDLNAPAQATESGQTLEDGEWESEECKNLVGQLKEIFEEKGKRKIIVIPRPSLEARIALTAWTRIDKFTPSASDLSDSDRMRILGFIDAFRDRGPEKTTE